MSVAKILAFPSEKKLLFSNGTWTWAHYLWNLSLKTYELFCLNFWQNSGKSRIFLPARFFADAENAV